MICNLQSFEINSFYCQKNNDSSDISYYLDVPQDYLDSVTHISVTSINIPDTFTQLDETDNLVLVEDTDQVQIVYSIGSYYTKSNMMLDLQTKLNANSPNGYTYTITDNNTLLDDRSMKITVNDNTKTKQIILSGKYLRYLYGLDETNTFTDELISKPINLTPISTVYIHSNCCGGYNTSGLASSDIICALDVKKCGTEQVYSVLDNAKPFNPVRNIRLKLTDFDNYFLNIYDNEWRLTITLFTLEESWISKVSSFIDFLVLKKMKH